MFKAKKKPHPKTGEASWREGITRFRPTRRLERGISELKDQHLRPDR